MFLLGIIGFQIFNSPKNVAAFSASGNYRMLVLTNIVEAAPTINGPWTYIDSYWFVVRQDEQNKFFRSSMHSSVKIQ